MAQHDPAGQPAHAETPQPRAARLRDMFEDLEEQATERHEAFAAGRPLGPKTGFGRLDAVIGGWLPPGLHTLHGRSGDGKSALALQMAATCGTPALLISCEMDPIVLLLRHTARCTDTFMNKLKGGNPPMDPAVLMGKVRAAAKQAPDLWLVDARTAWPSTGWIREKAEIAREGHQHVLVVIDSLHAWAAGAPGGLGEYEALNLAIASCLRLAAELRAPVLVIAERSRQAVKGGQAASAGSRKFEYSAETVLDLRRVDDPEEETDAATLGKKKAANGRTAPDGSRAMQIILRKNRHGPEGERIDLDYTPRVMRFSDPNEVRAQAAANGHVEAGVAADQKWF